MAGIQAPGAQIRIRLILQGSAQKPPTLHFGRTWFWISRLPCRKPFAYWTAIRGLGSPASLLWLPAPSPLSCRSPTYFQR